jgi:hypothetical protein
MLTAAGGASAWYQSSGRWPSDREDDMGCPQVCSGATLQCSFGAAPAMFNVLPVNRTLVGGMPAANIMDYIPLVNVTTFGMCSSLANPTVAAATAAALGALTPMPCIPATASPWVPGAPTVLLGGMPALDANSTLMCTWAGVIKIAYPGQVQMLIP